MCVSYLNVIYARPFVILTAEASLTADSYGTVRTGSESLHIRTQTRTQSNVIQSQVTQADTSSDICAKMFLFYQDIVKIILVFKLSCNFSGAYDR